MKKKMIVALPIVVIVLAVVLILFFIVNNKNKNMLNELKAQDYDKVEMWLTDVSYISTDKDRIEELINIIKSQKAEKTTDDPGTAGGVFAICFYKDGKLLTEVDVPGAADMEIANLIGDGQYENEMYVFTDVTRNEALEDYYEFFYKYSGYTEEDFENND